MKKPLISVIMSVYNGEEYLRVAVDSILNQTFTDFEFIIINDGSIDNTTKILQSIKDKRIKIINQTNHGLALSLNMAITHAQADLIARQDADDMSAVNRLEKQYNYMTTHPKTILLGTAFKVMDGAGNKLGVTAVMSHDNDIRREIYVKNPFCHGSVMFRKAAIEAKIGYRKSMVPAEDYDLWSRLIRVGQFANLPEPLYHYRLYGESVSKKSAQLQAQKTKTIIERLWRDGRPENLNGISVMHRHKELKQQDPAQARQFICDQIGLAKNEFRYGEWQHGVSTGFWTLISSPLQAVRLFQEHSNG